MPAGSVGERDAKDRIAEALRKHVALAFGGNEKRAAEDLGYDRQRLHSYISKTSFPGADVFDRVRGRWGLDLLNLGSQDPTLIAMNGDTKDRQLLLFDPQVRLANDGVEIVLERKGPGIAVGIIISPDVRISWRNQ